MQDGTVALVQMKQLLGQETQFELLEALTTATYLEGQLCRHYPP